MAILFVKNPWAKFKVPITCSISIAPPKLAIFLIKELYAIVIVAFKEANLVAIAPPSLYRIK